MGKRFAGYEDHILLRSCMIELDTLFDADPIPPEWLKPKSTLPQSSKEYRTRNGNLSRFV